MNTHTELVIRLCKDGSKIIDELTPEKAHLWHMASKLCSEAGEIMDAVGKHVIYNQPLNVYGDGGIVEELGDCRFYEVGIMECLGIHHELPINHNIEKLNRRYGKEYSDKAAQERKDKL